jgi:nucleotide-binding universal stress UspA family protein
MKVLVPIDGSKHSLEALKTAIELVKAKGAEISVINVVPSISSGMEDHEISPAKRERVADSMTRYADEVINKAVELLAAENVKPAHTRTIIAETSVPDALIDFAEKEKVDLIVMGSRGMSTSARFRMGSVATQVVKYSPCSVYVVKLPAA